MQRANGDGIHIGDLIPSVKAPAVKALAVLGFGGRTRGVAPMMQRKNSCFI